jgi:hypothetical protein
MTLLDETTYINQIHLSSIATVRGVNDYLCTIRAVSWVQVATPFAGVLRGRIKMPQIYPFISWNMV